MTHIRLVVAIMAVSCTYVFCADPAPDAPQSSSAVGAIKEYEKACALAEEARRQATVAAGRKLVEKLKISLQVATKGGDLKEANAINRVKTAVEAEIEAARHGVGSADKLTAKVLADSAWQKTTRVRAGDILNIAASGTWCVATSTRAKNTCDADGLTHKISDLVPNANYGALLGRIGNKTFVIGKTANVQVDEGGELEMRINDPGLGDNDGELAITIATSRGRGK